MHANTALVEQQISHVATTGNVCTYTPMDVFCLVVGDRWHVTTKAAFVLLYIHIINKILLSMVTNYLVSVMLYTNYDILFNNLQQLYSLSSIFSFIFSICSHSSFFPSLLFPFSLISLFFPLCVHSARGSPPHPHLLPLQLHRPPSLCLSFPAVTDMAVIALSSCAQP